MVHDAAYKWPKRNWANSGPNESRNHNNARLSGQKWVVKPSISNAKCRNFPGFMWGFQSKQTSISASLGRHSKVFKYFQPLIVFIFGWQLRVGWALVWIGWYTSGEDYVVGAPWGENSISSLAWFAFGTCLPIFTHAAKCCNCFDHCAHFGQSFHN